MATIKRSLTTSIKTLIKNTDSVIHTIIGPRQVGKTTASQQIIQDLKWKSVTANADSALPLGPEWIETHWQRLIALTQSTNKPVILVLDEIQKVKGWSETLKHLWDTHYQIRSKIRVLILGSSSLIVQKGLTESLSGRFLLHRFTHWPYGECRDAFGWTLNEWIFYGGYPGAAPFSKTPLQWKNYIRDSLIETVLSKDIFHLHTITKPALMRHLFALSVTFPAQIVSYNKMLGQLQDAGNTTTLANYLHILEQAFLISGLERFSYNQIRKKGSSPKLIIWNNALINALSLRSIEESKAEPNWWGHLVENAVGAHLINTLNNLEWQITYWRKDNFEMDFVIQHGRKIWGIEVKSGKQRPFKNNVEEFKTIYPQAKVLIIGNTGIPFEEFFLSNPLIYFNN